MPLSENSLQNGRGHDFGMDLDQIFVKKADRTHPALEHPAPDLEVAKAIQDRRAVVASMDKHAKILASVFDGEGEEENEEERLSPRSPTDRREIVEEIVSNFKSITGFEPKDVFDKEGEFDEGVVVKTAPMVKEYVQEKYGDWDDEVLYDLDDALMNLVFGSIRKQSQNSGGSVTTVRKHHKGDKARIIDEKTIKGPRHPEESPTEALVAGRSKKLSTIVEDFDTWVEKNRAALEREWEAFRNSREKVRKYIKNPKEPKTFYEYAEWQYPGDHPHQTNASMKNFIIEAAPGVTQYTSLNDATEVTGDSSYAPGDSEIWYVRRGYSREYGFGHFDELGYPQLSELEKTHVKIGSIKETDLEKIFMLMQGENWSPNGEAYDLITSLGASHTSMSVGDIIKIGNQAWAVDNFGFAELHEGQPPIKRNKDEEDSLEGERREGLVVSEAAKDSLKDLENLGRKMALGEAGTGWMTPTDEEIRGYASKYEDQILEEVEAWTQTEQWKYEVATEIYEKAGLDPDETWSEEQINTFMEFENAWVYGFVKGILKRIKDLGLKVKGSSRLVHEAKSKASPGEDLHEPTDQEREHEYMRIRTLGHDQLITRLFRIEDPQKMFAFAKALHSAKYDDLEELAYERLESMGWDRTGHWGGKKKAASTEIQIENLFLDGESKLEVTDEDNTKKLKNPGPGDEITEDFFGSPEPVKRSAASDAEKKVKVFDRVQLISEDPQLKNFKGWVVEVNDSKPGDQDLGIYWDKELKGERWTEVHPNEVKAIEEELTDEVKEELEKVIEKHKKDLRKYQKSFDKNKEVDRPDKVEKAAAAKCIDCGAPLNPVEVLLSEKSGRCKKCIEKKQKEVTGEETTGSIVKKAVEVSDNIRRKDNPDRPGTITFIDPTSGKAKVRWDDTGVEEDVDMTALEVVATDTLKKQVGQVSSDALGQESLGFIPPKKKKKKEDDEYERRIEREQEMLEKMYEPTELSFSEMASKVKRGDLGKLMEHDMDRYLEEQSWKEMELEREKEYLVDDLVYLKMSREEAQDLADIYYTDLDDSRSSIVEVIGDWLKEGFTPEQIQMWNEKHKVSRVEDAVIYMDNDDLDKNGDPLPPQPEETKTASINTGIISNRGKVVEKWVFNYKPKEWYSPSAGKYVAYIEYDPKKKEWGAVVDPWNSDQTKWGDIFKSYSSAISALRQELEAWGVDLDRVSDHQRDESFKE